ncbi:MAG: 7-cyano-7-deazaguanine synthase QueC [Alphaproteobacteria bacterium]|nr:7-cyano-7-deazaguanine synthase QueC [Alphaproteobacteria bacterium]
MRKLNPAHALVLFSGGQDSSIALAWALSHYEKVETIGFAYGQRHAVELAARAQVRDGLAGLSDNWRARLGEDHVVDLSGYGAIAQSALTAADRSIGFDAAAGLPTTFVPGRNLVFLAVAAGRAYVRGIGVLAAGMCEEDATGYPDCRAATLETQMAALCLGLDADMRLETPVLRLSKAASWALAADIGGDALVELIREASHTCYRGNRTPNAWGHGCGDCPACRLRAEGWADYAAGRNG